MEEVHPPSPNELIEALRRATPRIIVTPAIAVVLVMTFLGLVISGRADPFNPTAQSMLAVGANSFPLTVGQGQWWRLFTSTLLHFGVMHLLFNVWAFWNVGQLAERLFGNVSFAVMYLLAGIGGSLASVLWNQHSTSAGASGAIFGIFGGLLAFVVRNRSWMPPGITRSLRGSTLSFIVLNLVMGATIAFIDQAAHIGGLITGFAAGWVLARDVRSPGDSVPRRIVGGLTVALALTLIAVGLGFRNRGAAATHDASAKLQTGDFAGAVIAASKRLAQNPNDVNALVERGLAHAAQEHMRAAREDFEAALALQPDQPKLYLAVCRATFATGDDEATLNACEKIGDRNGAALTLVDLLYKPRALARLGRTKEAHQAIDRVIELVGNDHGIIIAARAEVRLREGFPDDAKALCKKEAVVTNKEAFDVCAVLLADLKAIDEGNLLFTTAEQGPLAPYTKLQRASFLLRAGRRDDALALLPREEDALSLNNRAWLELVAHDTASATAHIEASLKKDPDSAPALGTRCWVRAIQGDVEGAKADCARSVALSPGTDADEGMLAYLDGHMSRAVFLFRMQAHVDPVSASLMNEFIERAQNFTPDAGAATP